MAAVPSLPPDNRPSALYLVAHQGRLRNPLPVEVQHMRIRRYMDLLAELRGLHHHFDEAHDIYVDFNFDGSGAFPALMRLGEAVGQHRYRAIFVDLVGDNPLGRPSGRRAAYLRMEAGLRQLPVEVIDVSLDPAGVLLEKLEGRSTKWAKAILNYMTDGVHDMVCFFPGLAAEIVEAVFFRDLREKDNPTGDLVRRGVQYLASENPYAAGRMPWLPDSIWTTYSRYEIQERGERQAARRTSGEPLYRVAPDEEPKLIDEGLWGGRHRSTESMTKAESRLSAFGFEKIVDGQVLSFQRKRADFLLFADPRTEGKIEISAYRLVPSKRKRGKPLWGRVGSWRIRDSWWMSDPQGRFEVFLAKRLPPEAQS